VGTSPALLVPLLLLQGQIDHLLLVDNLPVLYLLYRLIDFLQQLVVILLRSRHSQVKLRLVRVRVHHHPHRAHLVQIFLLPLVQPLCHRRIDQDELFPSSALFQLVHDMLIPFPDRVKRSLREDTPLLVCHLFFVDLQQAVLIKPSVLVLLLLKLQVGGALPNAEDHGSGGSSFQDRRARRDVVRYKSQLAS
jgi:hypothetical protein